MNIKGRLKGRKYFQTAFGLIGKNFFKKTACVRTAHTLRINFKLFMIHR